MNTPKHLSNFIANIDFPSHCIAMCFKLTRIQNVLKCTWITLATALQFLGNMLETTHYHSDSIEARYSHSEYISNCIEMC